MKIPGLFQMLVIALIVIVLFGRGRISQTMGEFGRGFKGFKRGLGDDDGAASARLDGPGLDPLRAADKTAG